MQNVNCTKKSKVVNLHYTNHCNYRCRFCHSHFQKTPLTFDDWKTIIDNIMAGMDVERFNLAGGEPLAGEYIQDMIDYTLEHAKSSTTHSCFNAKNHF